MFCPKCGMFLNESELIRRNIKTMGNVPVEYDARCPNCNTEIGRMHWGKFTIHPELSETIYEVAPVIDGETSLIPPPPELRTILRPRKNMAEVVEMEIESDAESEPENPDEPDQDGLDTESLTRYCPHCGKPLPADY